MTDDLSARVAACVAEQERAVAQARREAAGVHTWTHYIPHEPTQRQLDALALDTVLEVLFGGAAGGGKSDWLLMSALQYVQVPRYAALLLRRTYSDLALPGALMDRAQEWLRGTDARWSAQEKTWTFPSGATLTFGYLESESDKYRYQSSEFQLIGFDELAQFEESQYLYLFSRLRRLAGADIPLRMRSASNPDGAGLDWVRARFVKVHDSTRRFVPARLEDNPYLDRAAYEASLSLLDPVTQARLWRGDWDAVRQGNEFKRDWFRFVDRLPDGVRWQVRPWDLALTAQQTEHSDPDWTASCVGATDTLGNLYLGKPLLLRANSADVKREIEFAFRDEVGVRHGVGGALHEKALRDVLLAEGIYLDALEERGDKTARIRSVVLPVASALRVFLVGTPSVWDRWLDQVVMFPAGHDDALDVMEKVIRMLGMAIQPRVVRQEQPVPSPYGAWIGA